VIPGASSFPNFDVYNDQYLVSPSEFGANTQSMLHVFVPCSFTPDKIAFDITTAGSAGCKMEIGIYGDNKSLLVGSGVVTDGTTVECDSTGVKILTGATSPAATGLGTEYPAGWYWIASTSNETALRIRGLKISSNALGIFTAAASGSASGYLSGAQATTDGALKTSWTTGSGFNANSQSGPVILLSK
jgi:hypothetical protein